MEEKYFDFTKSPDKKIKHRKIINDGEPLISIITPYYNGDKYIHETAKSIFNQTFPYFEWIIVNDGSTAPNTKKVLDNLAASDTRIKILNKENGGPAAARYFGAEHAKSDILFTLDADDMIDNTMLECGYFTMLTNPDITWVYSSIATFGESNYLYNPKFDTMAEKRENLMPVASFIKKDKFLETVEYKSLPKAVHEDWYMWLTFLSKGYKPAKMNFYGFWYRTLSSGRLQTINKNKEHSQIAEKYIKEVGSKVKKRVGAIQFPTSCNYDFSSYPRKLDINKSPIIKKDAKKRLLFLFPWCVVGGADLFNLELIKMLKNKEYEITIVTTETKEYILRQTFEEYSDEYFDLTTFLKREDWAGFLSHIIKSRNIDLVFESNSFYGYYAIPWLKCMHPEVKFVDYLHSEDWSWRDGAYPRDSVAISRYLDRTYTCTEYLKNTMYNKMNRKVNNTDVIYIGTNTEFYNPELEGSKAKELKEKYKGKKVILFPCRIEFLKRPLFLVKVVKEIVKENQDIVCLMVGDGEALQMTKDYVKNNNLGDYFEFTGMQSDLRPYYKIANVTVVCSLVEGLTLTSYESLSMGTPVVSSNVGGQAELIDDTCGKIIRIYQSIEKDLNNFDYSTEEIAEFKSAILKILNTENYSELRNTCRQKILNGFSRSNCLEKLISSLNEIIDEKNNISSDIYNNVEIAERYLILFNEIYKNRYPDQDNIPYGNLKEKIAYVLTTNKDLLWRFPPYRWAVHFIKYLRK